MIRDLTTGSPIRRILSFCIPLLIGNLFQQIYNMADSIIVGHYLGVDAFAAVGSTGALNFLILGFALGLCSGLCIPIAQNFGAGDIKSLRKAGTHALYISGVVSLLIGVIMSIYTRPLLVLLQTPPNIVDDAFSYISTIFIGTFTIVLYNILAGFMRSLGDSRTPLYYLVFACIVNILLDLLFIGIFHMGVEGAAWATVIAQFLSGLLCLRAIRRHFPILHFTRRDAQINGKLLIKLISISVPMGLQFSITALGSIVMQAAVNGLGSGAVAAMSAGGKVQNLVIAPLESAGNALVTFTSQNCGAHRMDRVKKGVWHTMLICSVYCVLAMFIVLFYGSFLAGIFLDHSAIEIHTLIQQVLSINSYFYIPLAGILVYRNSLQGIGYTNAAMGAGLLEMIGRTGVALGLVGSYGFIAACFSNPVAWILADLFLIPAYLLALRKKEMKLSMGFYDD